ncbi:hypothetical protein J4E93_003447 [Alternaria ventricosa]|uniref:uncharacterized protein n=1 Tax=Alternaria ventricosa TaxID=1187951 RepID=UPI0020C25AFF|nr:uncharacterized protein J4E93_003447 [Alternaria ventricosa]KAI4649133.1 hypothetical protein J4E93_003447 [Alternaria ventricosa]
MAPARLHLQRVGNPHKYGFRKSKRTEDAHAVPSYQQKTHFHGYFHGTPPPDPPHIAPIIPTQQRRIPLAPYFHENVATSAQAAAYEDAITTRAWRNEWDVAPDDFGPSKPLLLLNRPANVDLMNHTWETELVHLCHWDQYHEPEGVLSQRLAKERRRTKKKLLLGNSRFEQDKIRKKVKLAAATAEVVDLTQDETVEGGNFPSYAGIEEAWNYPPGYFPITRGI